MRRWGVWGLLFVFVLGVGTSTFEQTAQAVQKYNKNAYEEFDAPYYKPSDKKCLPADQSGHTTVGDAVEVGISIYGGTWDGKKAVRNPGDDNGTSRTGPLAGRTAFAELSNKGTKDFKALADVLKLPEDKRAPAGDAWKGGLKPKAKVKLTYKGRSIIMEKADVGSGGGDVGGKVRAVDIWYEAAKLLDFREGLGTATVQLVDDSTPVTPLNGTPTQGETTDTATAVPSGASTGARAFSFLMKKGLSRNQAIGIVANLMQESGGQTLDLNPMLQNSIGAFGIAQWFRERRTALQEFAKTQNKTEGDFEVQINFLWKEITGPYRTSVYAPLSASTTLEDATRIFLENFEKPCNKGKDCDAEFSKRLSLAQKASQSLSGVSADGSADTSGTCAAAENSASGDVKVDGYAFPLKNYKLDEKLLSCSISGCHHDGTAAFDLMADEGTEVLAIYDGEILSNRPYSAGGGGECSSVQFRANDGWVYWYGHTTIKHPAGTKFKAGDVLGKLGNSRCAMGAGSHLHIDRGSPKGHTGGDKSARDKDFVPLMQKLLKKYKESKG